MKERYLNTLVRTTVDPIRWVNDEFPRKDEESVLPRKVLIESKLKLLKEYHSNAVMLDAVEPSFQDIEETL